MLGVGQGGLAAWTGSAAVLCALTGVPPGCDAAWWGVTAPLLQEALRTVPASMGWTVLLQCRLFRRQRRLDAVLVSDRAVLAVLVRHDGFRAVDRLAVEDAALDLQDFHAGCRGMPVVPVLLVPNGAHARGVRPLPLAGATAVVEVTRLLLPGFLHEVACFPPCGLDPAHWPVAPYRPVPALMEAACTLYARHGVASLAWAQGTAHATVSVRDVVQQAQAGRHHAVVFVTGDPGTGKTLCGLDLAFTPGLGAAFLTGNPSLVHVLRDALARDAASRGMELRAARRRMEGVIQALPAFRDHHLRTPGPPSEHVAVMDEAQRCWSAAHAIAKTRHSAVPLTDSEPGHLLDIMARHRDWSVLVCLLGGGQEIHAGEGGLAEWGMALASRPAWRVVAPPDATLTDPRQHLALPGVHRVPALRLHDPMRTVGAPRATAWVDAMLANDPEAARSHDAPRITRCLHALRRALRPRGTRQSGLVASSGARRLRAEGLGSVLPHQDADAVARWFGSRWPDIRSADALETVATEFAIQGLELDHIGLCWDLDLMRGPAGWRARSFRGAAWTELRRPDAMSNRLNAYRVLLTRARHGTVVWVPRGDARDPTRDPALYDGVAAYLHQCGALPLDGVPVDADTAPMPEPALL